MHTRSFTSRNMHTLLGKHGTVEDGTVGRGIYYSSTTGPCVGDTQGTRRHVVKSLVVV